VGWAGVARGELRHLMIPECSFGKYFPGFTLKPAASFASGVVGTYQGVAYWSKDSAGSGG
jgi:hypothetical protein